MSNYRKLFPPNIPYYYPPILKGQNLKVYFNLSTVNYINEVKQVQIKITDLNTNKPALNLSGAALGIYGTSNIQYDSDKKMYYVELDTNNINTTIYTDFRLQVRLSNIDATLSEINDITWINNNIINLSEWSNVSIIKIIITRPSYGINGLSEGTINNINKGYYKVKGYYNNSQENLKSYRMLLTSIDTKVIYDDSGEIIYNGNIEYDINYKLKDNQQYKIILKIKTNNNYEEEKEYTIIPTINASVNNFYINNINNLYTIDTDNASINFNIKYNNLNSNLKYISIYQNGLLINKFNLLYGYNNELNFKNYFIKSGIPYTFDIVLSDNNTNYLIHTINNVVNYYEHCWLIEDLNTQIMLGYSPNVSSISLNIKENIVETFNKYPLIVRTGLTNYKSLQFSAFLTYNGNESFIKELDGDEDYYVKEKVFREKIYKILTNGKPKIFKTDTEDLILCKITNITLTPKTELSRIVYEVSFNVIEIDEINYNNLKKYNLI